ncbi:MAG: LysM peptidoglycan-binding domain-containing protein [Leptolyngbyaceae cyanobacterium bins.302]|nr:LysM peptidoglycan-binding domain-containing protein [Leptolyngbyaceae cyanobacterium bins.302]
MNTNLERLTITPIVIKSQKLEQRLAPITVLFNPESYTVSKTVNWNKTTSNQFNAPLSSFGGGDSRQLTLKLLFDVSLPVSHQGRSQAVGDVRQDTNKIVALTQIARDEQHPRVCEVAWGKAPVGSDFPFMGVITSLTQEFTQFSRSGKPTRATLDVTFTEYLNPDLDKRKTDPELTTQVVRGGATLDSIAADLYHNPKQWRVIAEANNIDDPRQLTIGRRLIIPDLK